MGNVICKKRTNQNKTNDKFKCEEIILNSNEQRLIAVKKFSSIDNSSISKNCEKIIMFIHGVAGSSYVWHKQIEYFINLGFVVVCVDLLGHGSSKILPSYDDYSFYKLSADCLMIFDHVCSEKINVVVGHSYGCSMATVIAHDRPFLVSRLVLISGGSAKPLGPPDKLFESPLCCIMCIHPIIMFLFRKKTFHCKSQSLTMKHLFINVDSFVLKATMLGQLWDEGGETYHQQISVPTLLIHGNEDKIVSIDEEWDMQFAIRNCTLETLDSVGHFAMLEAPVEVNRLIRNHIERNCEIVPNNEINNNVRVKITRGMTLYEKTSKCNLRSAFSFSEYDTDIIKIDFDISNRKTLPSGLLLTRRSTIRKPRLKLDNSEQSLQNTLTEVISESSI